MFDAVFHERIATYRRDYGWPRVKLPFVHDAASHSRESLRARGLLPVLELAAGETCPLVIELRATRGIVAKMATAAIWDATVIAIGHWCDPNSTVYYEGWRRAAPCAFPMFARDCAECRDRVVPLRKTPAAAINQLKSFDIAPGIVISGGGADEVAADAMSCFKAFPATRLIGVGWRGAIGDAVRRVACRLELEVEVIDDAWLVWRHDEPWVEMTSSLDIEGRYSVSTDASTETAAAGFAAHRDA